MRKNILSAALAAAMTINITAIVAAAENDSESIDKNVKTKSDLENYVRGFDTFITGDLSNYGSISAAAFDRAYDYAEIVLADPQSEENDYTAAYVMLEAVYNNLQIHSVTELTELMKKYKSIYESDNYNNRNTGDIVYEAESYNNFVSAYMNAESAVNSDNMQIVTDAYETLMDSYNNLYKLQTITKSAFQTALKAYNEVMAKEYKYEPWEIGSMPAEGTIPSGKYDNFAGKTITWGALYSYFDSKKDSINDAYKAFNGNKGSNNTSDTSIINSYNDAIDSVALLKLWQAEPHEWANTSNISRLLDKYHDVMVYDFNKAEADDLYTEIASLSDVSGSVKKSSDTGSRFIYADIKDEPDGWTVSGKCETIRNYADSSFDTYNYVYKTTSAEISVTLDCTVYVQTDSNGLWHTGYSVTTEPNQYENYKTIYAGSRTNLLKFIEAMPDTIEGADDDSDIMPKSSPADYVLHPNPSTDNAHKNDIIDGGKDGEYMFENSDIVPKAEIPVNLATAYRLAKLYLNSKRNDALRVPENVVADISTTGIVEKGSESGSRAELTIVQKYLKRALIDKYGTVETLYSYSKNDVVDLTEYAYKLTDDSGDTWMFSPNHLSLVEARQEAIDWVSSASAGEYIDNHTIVNDKTSTEMYLDLKEACNAVENDLKAFEYKFGEIYDKLAEVCGGLDEGKYAEADKVKKALYDTAYKLIAIGSMDTEFGLDNDAFNIYGFCPDNRVFTLDTDYELEEITIESPEKNSVSKSHNELTKAYRELLELISHPAEETAPETPPQEPTPETPAVVIGDVNGDGSVNAMDAAEILKYCANLAALTDEALKAADFNGDKTVNALDAAAILKAITLSTDVKETDV